MWIKTLGRWRQLNVAQRLSLALGFVAICAGLGWLGLPSSTVPAEVTRDQLEMHDGRLCLLGSDKPYSGLLVADYIGTKKRKSVLPLEKGLIHGTVQGWHENGQIEVKEPFRRGVSHGTRTRWYANGEKRSEAEILEGKLHGQYIEWHDNGQKALVMTLAEGKAEGLVEAWFPDGTLKSKSVMKNGEVSHQEFFNGAASGASSHTAFTNQ